MKRILYVTDVFPPHCGGSGWSVYFFARNLRNHGFDVRILSLDGQPREYDGFQIEALSLSKCDVPFVANLLRENRDLPRIESRLRQISSQFDVLHAHHRFSAIALAQSEPSRFFATIRDYWPICFCGRSIYRTENICNRNDFTVCSNEESVWKGIAAPLVHHWFDERLNRWNLLMRKAEKLFCISKHLQQQLLPVFNQNQLEVLPNFAEEIGSNRNRTLPQEFVVYVGRLERNKGVHLLPEILQASKARIPIVIVGEGTLRNELEKKFEERSIRAHFTGYLEYPEMLEVLRKSKFVLFPSIWPEPLGRVLIEAAMLRKAVITFNHPGGHHDIVNHSTSGLMAGSVEEYAAFVARLLQDPELERSLGDNARKVYEQNFSPESVIPKLLQNYAI